MGNDRVPSSNSIGRAPVDSVALLTVIRTHARLGRGTDDDPVRIVTQYWDLDDNLLWADDPTGALDPKTGFRLVDPPPPPPVGGERDG